MKTSEWKNINVPKYPELNVHIWVCEKEARAIYLLSWLQEISKTRKQFLFNIIGNADPDFLNAKIDEAHKKRISGEIAEDSEKIEIRVDILEELMKTNYESIKFH